ISDSTEFDATQDTTVYVEGITKSASRAAEEVQLKWVKDSFSATLNRVRFTVYEVTGATDVPGYSAYNYQASIPGGGTGSWTATNGTVQSGGSTNSATILWGAGAAVGKASFTPVAGFTVDREVNVVKVELETTAGANNQMTFGNPPTQNPGNPRQIISNA